MPNPARLVPEIQVPTVVLLAPKQKTVEIEVLHLLHNTAGDNVVVGAHSHEEPRHWHLLDENHKEVQRAPKPAKAKPAKGRAGVIPSITQTILGGQSHRQHRVISLDASKLKPGGEYTVRTEIWGHIAEAKFVVADVPALMIKKPKKNVGIRWPNFPPSKTKPPIKKGKQLAKTAKLAAQKAEVLEKAAKAQGKKRPTARRKAPASKRGILAR